MASQLRAAIFDFGGVMTEPVFTGTSVAAEHRHLLEMFVAESAEIYHLPTSDHDLHLLETGAIVEGEFFDRFAVRVAAQGHPPMDGEEVRRAIFGPHGLAMCEQMMEATRELRRLGIKTGLISNTWAASQMDIRERVDRHDLFDVAILSSEVGLRKPDPRIYALACEQLSVAAGECLFVDDMQCNIDAAAALGMEVALCADPVATAKLVLGRFAAEMAS